MGSTSRWLDDLHQKRPILERQLEDKRMKIDCQLEEMWKKQEALITSLETKEAKMAKLERSLRGVEESPTDQERQLAMELLGFRDNHLHIAIVGESFVGKSSLVNAIRGLSDKDFDAAKAGVTESTDRISQYSSPDDQKIIYYDIPGAGTKKFSRYGYFKNQGLYVMNALILVWCNRVTDTYIYILKNCIKHSIPFFLIRTQCDRYIREYRDEVRDEDGYEENERRFVEAVYKKISQFYDAACADAIDGIKSAYEGARIKPPSDEELKEHVLLVNKNSLRKFVKSGVEDENALDERLLMDKIARLQHEVAGTSNPSLRVPTCCPEWRKRQLERLALSGK